MPVLAGIAIPRTAPDMDAAKALVTYMLKPETQIATLRATNFFPVIDVALPDDLPPSVKAAGAAVAKMSASADANPSLLPAGLGDKGVILVAYTLTRLNGSFLPVKTSAPFWTTKKLFWTVS